MRYHLPPVLLLVLAATAAGVFITWNGINQHYDAAWYLVYARGVAAGDGFMVPISSYNMPTTTNTINQWPPFYPLVLAAGAWWDLHAWARLVTVASLVGAIVLTYALALRVTDASRTAATAAALLALSVPAMSYDGFSFARSETLFTTGALGFLLLLTHYTSGDRAMGIRWALWAALVAALLTMTRYVGVAFGVLGGAWMLGWAWRSKGSWRQWLPVGAFGVSFVPIGLYALYLRRVTGSFTGTQTTADALTLAGVPRGLATITTETLHGLSFAFRLVGLRSNLWGLVAALALVGLFGWWAARHGHRLRGLVNGTHALYVAYVLAYTGVFWALGARSAIITEETARHYIAVYPVIMVLIVSVVHRIPANRWLLGGVLALYLMSGAVAMRIPAAGLYYNRPDWRTDPLLHSLDDRLPPATLVHTQYTSHLSMLLGRDVPVRTFGTIGAYEAFACDDLIYPAPYTHAAFTLVDAAYLRQTPAPQAETFMREWAAACGTVTDYANNGFMLLMVIRLNDGIPPQ